MNNYWISFYWPKSLGSFTYEGPWWISGYRMEDDGSDTPTVCMAVRAKDVMSAQETVKAVFDTPPHSIEWRFTEERGGDWTPFNDRFPRGDWMKWPEPA